MSNLTDEDLYTLRKTAKLPLVRGMVARIDDQAAEIERLQSQLAASQRWFVQCKNCLARGPRRITRESAVKAWNALAGDQS